MTTTTRKIGRNRGKARLWLEGAFLSAAGWTQGTRFRAVFAAGSITYLQDPDGDRSVSGTDARPIIDTNTDEITRSLAIAGTEPNARIRAEAGRITITAELLTLASISFGFFPAHAKAVVVGCEFSGLVRDAIAARGHDVISCDFLESERPEGTHHQGDLVDLLGRRQWDAGLFFPPCTYLCSSGAWRCHPKHDPQGERLAKQRAAVEFVRALWSFGIPQIAMENPIGVLSSQFRKPDQIIQPWQFGHGETKATCLWLQGFPLLRPTNVVAGREPRIWSMGPSPTRWLARSRTYVGIALAMATQWF